MVSRACLTPWRPLIGLLLLGALQCKAEILQEATTEAAEGKELELNCKHPSIGNDNIFWYRQFPNQTPHYIASGYNGKTDSRDLKGVSLDIAQDRKSSRLSFARVNLVDSAVYYCALRRITDGYKFIFGSGTRLVVILDLDNAEPSVYKLTPAKEGTEKISACLFTDYSPGNITVGISQKDLKEAQSSIVVVKENEKDQGSYGTVLWGPAGDNFQCSASQDGNMFTEETNADAGNCINGQGTTVGPTPTAAVAPPPTFETDEQLNLLSLTVLGLRIIFFKSVAFNLLFTFRLWSS